MYPLIAGDRDEVVIAGVSGHALRRGDIVLYLRKDGTHVLHRIHHIKNGEFYLVGDAQSEIEGPVKREQVIAYAEALVRKSRTIPCGGAGYRTLSGAWLFLRPFRPLILKTVLRVRSVLKI